MYKPYLIRTPDFDITSGGIRVMYALYGWLLARGQIAYLNAKVNVPSVGVYPEIYHGNDMNAQTVVRYILNKPGVMASYGVPGPTKFDKSDKIYVFSKIYDTFGVDENHLFFCPVINLHLFKNEHRNRTKTCYLIGKGMDKHYHPEDSILLTRDFAQNQTALADLLNDCKTLYGYDHMSAMYDIARLCGCKVHYFGDGTKEELQGYEPGLDGMHFYRGINPGDMATIGDDGKFDSDSFRDNYQQMIKLFSDKLDMFIEETQV